MGGRTQLLNKTPGGAHSGSSAALMMDSTSCGRSVLPAEPSAFAPCSNFTRSSEPRERSTDGLADLCRRHRPAVGAQPAMPYRRPAERSTCAACPTIPWTPQR